MKILNTRNNLSLQLLYTGFHHAGTEWCYANIISPFSRLYLITEGKAAVYMNKKKYLLSANELFIIPKFTFHTYECDDFMKHYYICFFDETIGGRSIFDTTEIRYQLPAEELDLQLMLRFIALNQGRHVPSVDPKIYDNKRVIHTFNQDKMQYNLANEIESNGILLQLFSRFIANENKYQAEAHNQYERLDLALSHINNNIDRRITVMELASLMCISPDHFSRIFKRVIGLSPCQYIQSKRIERAQTLLLTSQLSITEIAETIGIPNISQFSNLFTKQTKRSPREYREMTKIISSR